MCCARPPPCAPTARTSAAACSWLSAVMAFGTCVPLHLQLQFVLLCRVFSLRPRQDYDDMAQRVIDLWAQRVLVPGGEGKQKSFVRPLEPDASYDSHEAGEVRPSAALSMQICHTLRMCFVPTLLSPSARRDSLLSLQPKVPRTSHSSTPRPASTRFLPFSPPLSISVADQHAFNAAEMCSKKVSFPSAQLAPVVGGRLRVGFVSVEFHDRPVGRDLINLFESLDVQQLDISCFCLYDLTPTKPRVQFEYRERLQAVRVSRNCVFLLRVQTHQRLYSGVQGGFLRRFKGHVRCCRDQNQ